MKMFPGWKIRDKFELDDNIFGLRRKHDRAEKQTSIHDEHSAMNQFNPFNVAKHDCIDLHPINQPINAMQELNIHLKNAIHIRMPTMCSSGDEHIGDLEKRGTDERSESRNPKVKRSVSVESRETCAEQCFSNWNPIRDSHSKQNSIELFHRRHELQLLQAVDSNINTNEDGAFLKNEIPYQIESPEFVFERKVVSDPITEYDELEDNNVITGNDWNGRCYATVSPTECVNRNGLEKEFLPGMKECLSNTTLLLKLISSLLTRILNCISFCRSTSTSRPSISHVTPYQLGWKSCFLYTCLFFVMPASTAETIVNVQHLSVIVGPSLRLHCSVNYPDPVIWRHEHVGTGDPNYVYHHDYGLRGQYKSGGRHSITNGTNDLVITNVTDSDAGKYTCEEGAVVEEPVDVYDIVILKSVPSCESNIVLADVIGENDCGIDPDVLQLQCSVVYSGNFVPVLLWQNSGEHVMIGTNVSTSIQDETNHITVSTLTVIANMGLNDTYFTCQVVGSQSVGVVPESKTEKITVHSLHNSFVAPEINMKNKKEISCAANSSQPCNYQWTHQYEKYKIAINGSTLNFQDVSFGDGIYECQAECLLRGQICHTMPRRITVVNGCMKNCEKTVDDFTSRMIAIACGAFSMILLGAAYCALLLKTRKHKDRRTENSTPKLKIQIRVRPSSKRNSRNNEDPQTDKFTNIDLVPLSSPSKKVDNVPVPVPVQVVDSDSNHHSLRLVPVYKESQKSNLFSSTPGNLIDLSSSHELNELK